MDNMEINGKEIAASLLEALIARVETLKEKNITPSVAIILVGNDPASERYVKSKQRKAEKIGATSTLINLPKEVSEDELVEKIKELNNDPLIHGIIVQRPLPPHINSEAVNNATDPKKDIDGFRTDSLFLMPLAEAVLKILEEVYKNSQDLNSKTVTDWLKAKTIVVIGKGETGGGPIISLLKKKGIPCIVLDSKTENRSNKLKNADIIISAVGKKGVFTSYDIKKGVTLIGVGMHKEEDGNMHGDYDQTSVRGKAGFYTPIPGGVGPVNVAMLLENLLKAADRN